MANVYVPAGTFSISIWKGVTFIFEPTFPTTGQAPLILNDSDEIWMEITDERNSTTQIISNINTASGAIVIDDVNNKFTIVIPDTVTGAAALNPYDKGWYNIKHKSAVAPNYVSLLYHGPVVFESEALQQGQPTP